MNRTWIIGGAAILAVVVLAAGAYFGAGQARSGDEAVSVVRTSAVGKSAQTSASAAVDNPTSETKVARSEPAKDARPRAPVRVMELVNDDGSGPVSMRISIEPSPDLPETSSEVGGVFLRREDNSVFVGTGSTELNVDIHIDETGAIEPSVSLTSNGPEIEVVVSHDTVLYEDVTDIPGFDGVAGKGGDHTIQQTVKRVDSLEELKGNAELQVWGSKRGDRVVADVMVYRIVNPDLGI